MCTTHTHVVWDTQRKKRSILHPAIYARESASRLAKTLNLDNGTPRRFRALSIEPRPSGTHWLR